MKIEDIPNDWWLWIKIAKNCIERRKAIKRGRNDKEQLLIALCLSAAKWLTGYPDELGILSGSMCGLCDLFGTLNSYNDDDCEGCPLIDDENCTDMAKKGESMRLYAKLLKELS